jgi:hypothetical protein
MARPPKISNEVLSAALVGLEEQRRRLENQISEVRALMGKRGPGRPPAAARAEAGGGAAAKPAKRKKRNLSPEGRARIIAAIKKRWATARAAKKAS